MQVSSRREKAKGTNEEIEKALLTYCSQLGNFEVGCVCVRNSAASHMAWSRKRGWFLCTTPTKCCRSMSDDSRAQKKCTRSLIRLNRPASKSSTVHR